MSETAPAPPATAARSHLRRLVSAVGTGGTVVAVLLVWWARDSTSDERLARQIVQKVSSTPSTIQWVDEKVVASFGDARVVQVEFDEQNQFGAMLRHRRCVPFRRTAGGGWTSRGIEITDCAQVLSNEEKLRLLETAKSMATPE